MWFSRRSPSNIMVVLLGLKMWFRAVATWTIRARVVMLLSYSSRMLRAARSEVARSDRKMRKLVSRRMLGYIAICGSLLGQQWFVASGSDGPDAVAIGCKREMYEPARGGRRRRNRMEHQMEGRRWTDRAGQKRSKVPAKHTYTVTSS